MNGAAVVAGMVMLAAGIFGLRLGWRKHDQASTRIIEDIHRINAEKPDADLDSDADFVKHKANAASWIAVLGISLIFTIIGGGIALAGLT